MAGVNPDLLKERASATFNVEQMTYILDGSEEMTKRRREIQAEALKDKELTGGPDVGFLSREEYYDDAARRALYRQKLLQRMEITDPMDVFALQITAFPWDVSPDSVHGGMFVVTMEGQCTPQQKERWLSKVHRKEYLGTYAQTEMGHGTFLRGLETTATYDQKTEEFVVNTPRVSAMKWWPGGLGKTSNCAVVMAQLYSQGICHGMYPFFVQLRDWDSHQPLPGITVGDIGPKFGFNSIDNGFLRFDDYRIPRGNMLMRHAEVLTDGTFRLKTTRKKPTYGTMTRIRANIVYGIGAIGLAAATTIAVRYSAVRRQSELKPGAPEPQIMDYQTQQYKLYPYLAMAYAYRFVAYDLMMMYFQTMGELDAGEEGLMPELHSLSSGLKALTTSTATLGTEQAGLACGGHGFSLASGLPKLYSYVIAGVTVEGENSVLYLQTARHMVKCYNRLKTDQTLQGSTAFLAWAGTDASTIDDSFSLASVVSALEHRTRRMVGEAADSIASLQSRGMAEYDARNQCGVMLTRCARAYCETHVIKTFASSISTVTDSAIVRVLTDLCRLLGAYYITNNTGDFLEDGYMTRAQLELVRDREISLLSSIRPNAIALVDAFDFRDHILGSILGRYDGNVYENLYKWAQQSPLNATQVHPSYHKYLKPMIKANI